MKYTMYPLYALRQLKFSGRISYLFDDLEGADEVGHQLFCSIGRSLRSDVARDEHKGTYLHHSTHRFCEYLHTVSDVLSPPSKQPLQLYEFSCIFPCRVRAAGTANRGGAVKGRCGNNVKGSRGT